MRSLFISRSQAGRQSLHKLWVNTQGLPQEVFATLVLGIKGWFVRSLSECTTQAYALLNSRNNLGGVVFVHIVHTPNNRYNKGD